MLATCPVGLCPYFIIALHYLCRVPFLSLPHSFYSHFYTWLLSKIRRHSSDYYVQEMFVDPKERREAEGEEIFVAVVGEWM